MKYKNNKFKLKNKNLTSYKLDLVKNGIIKKMKSSIKILVFKNQEGWIDNKKKIISFGYDKCFNFVGNIAKFRKNKKYGFINKKGEIIIENISSILPIIEKKSLFLLKINRKKTLMDNKGIILIRDVDDFKFGKNIVFTRDGFEGWLLEDGTIIEGEFNKCCSFSNDLGTFFKNGKYGVIHKNGTILLDNYQYLSGFYNNYSSFKEGTKYGWIDSSGKVLAKGFDECWNFNEGFAVFKRNDSFGWIDENGKILAEGFQECHNFKEDFSIFKQDNKYGWMDKNGKILAKDFDYCRNFSEEYARFFKDNKEGWIDKTGKIYTKNPY